MPSDSRNHSIITILAPSIFLTCCENESKRRFAIESKHGHKMEMISEIKVTSKRITANISVNATLSDHEEEDIKAVLNFDNTVPNAPAFYEALIDQSRIIKNFFKDNEAKTDESMDLPKSKENTVISDDD